MTNRVRGVLFLCTGNSARSIMAECILARLGKGRFRAFSAGSRPNGAVHPLALAILQQFGYPTDGLRSKSLDEFSGPASVPPDFVLTLCDSAASESCPVWPGAPMMAHWGLADPAAASGSQTDRARAFADAYRHLHGRIEAFVALPIAALDRVELKQRLDAIGRMSVSRMTANGIDGRAARQAG
jgi:arsenate reductase (thioredoxin)